MIDKTCERCNNKGFVMYEEYSKKMNDSYWYVTRCRCENSAKYSAWPFVSSVIDIPNIPKDRPNTDDKVDMFDRLVDKVQV